MAKHVFRPTEIVNLSRKVFIQPPQIESEEEEPEDLSPVDEAEYAGPTVEDLRREADAFKESWEKEKAEMIAQARDEAESIVKEAERVAFDEIKKKNNQAKKIRQEADTEAEGVVAEARNTAKEIADEANAKVEGIEKEAFDTGYKEGREKGYLEGKSEVDRLVERLHVVLSKAIEKRNEIIDESETQLINLVLLIAKKVIKVISENQRNVVINNVIQALRKLKSRGDVIIRVNLADLELTSDHTRDFMEKIENVKSVTVLEDSSVDRGGCIIESDLGQIDARISSQINEIEEKILELIPIRTRSSQ